MTVMDQDQLAEISTPTIPLEKGINNGKGLRDETCRQHSFVALTLRGSPSFVFPWLIFLTVGNSKKSRWKSVRLRTESRWSGFGDRSGKMEERPWPNQGLGQWPERTQLHNSQCPGHLVLCVSNMLDLPRAPFN